MDEQGIDRLSSLPDEILIKIISLLPLKSAVATAVLSRQWISIWKETTAIRFSGNYPSFLTLYTIFNHIFKQISSPNILNFDVYYSYSDYQFYRSGADDVVIRLLFKFCLPHMKEIKVSLKSPYLKSIPSIEVIPPFLLTSNSLEVLELDLRAMSVSAYDNSCVSIPNLRKLKLFVKEFYNIEFLNNLVKSSPLLESLKVKGELILEKVKKPSISITAKNLKCLNIDLFTKDLNEFHAPKLTIVIDTPKLQILDVGYSKWLRLSFTRTPNKLGEARISLGNGWNVSDLNVTQGLKLIRSINFARSITLKGDILILLGKMDKEDLPLLENLTELKIVFNSMNCLNGLESILGCCPNLEVVVLQHKEGFQWSFFLYMNKNWLVLLNACSTNKIKMKFLDNKGNEDSFAEAIISRMSTMDYENDPDIWLLIALQISMVEFGKFQIE